MTDMTPEQRIDANLDSVLRASGSALKHYTLPGTLEAMRKAMRKVMSDSYIQGSNDCHKVMAGGRRGDSMKIDMSGFDHPWLVIAATRYSLGRKTIAACAFAGDLAASWDKIPANVQGVIRLDVEDAFREADEHPARWDKCDRESWEKVRRQWA